jgi:hypothetical protein
MNVRIAPRVSVTLAAVLLLFAFQARSEAGLVFTMDQVGSDVVVTASGTVNTAGLTKTTETAPNVGSIWPSTGLLWIAGSAATGAGTDIYESIIGPASFGGGGVALATSGSGDEVVLDASGTLSVPKDYISGTAISGTMTFAGTTIAALGATPGTYTWTWGSGPDADFATLNVVPEPGSLALFGLSALGVGLIAYRRRKKQQPA